MRFLENGPSIPDQLLTARDEGRVVFFCGAGVSKAKAGLNDFFGLAEQVIDQLGALENDPARRILSAAQEVGNSTGLSGLISADGIFGVLEQDFEIGDVERHVANALKPVPPVDLSAHKTLIRLAQTPEGRLQLVTTNFDRLFEDCDDGLTTFHWPKLPSLKHGGLLDGIIHLHGVVNSDYSGAGSGPFVLSTAQFGRAYLSETWATDFIKEILERYFVVFIGYAADDPPIKYLLEALNTETANSRNMFAFQSDEDNEALSRWRQKGVTPISYSAKEEHKALWETLGEWAVRADAPDAWFDSVIENAQKGPEELRAYERGQVKHLVSTLEGARRFASAEKPSPATWLCVFDPDFRYRTPQKVGEDEIDFDPFQVYGLDDDEVPPRIDTDDHYAKRETPAGAWGLFQAKSSDVNSLDPKRFSNFHGFLSRAEAELPSRLSHIGIWLSRVVDDPAAIWWAAQKSGLHPQVRNVIEHKIYGEKTNCPDEIVETWAYLFESWSSANSSNRHEWFDYKRRIKRLGWNSKLLRDVFRSLRPQISHHKPYYSTVSPPIAGDQIRLQDIVRIDVEYPQLFGEIDIGDEWLPAAVKALRSNLELAVRLENEIGGYGLRQLTSISETEGGDDDDVINRYSRTHGLSGHILFFVDLFKRLIEIDLPTSQDEFELWLSNDDHVFARLCLWAIGNERLVDANVAGNYLAKLEDAVFWDAYHQRDLLLSMAKRWPQFSKNTRTIVGEKLLRGPTRWPDEEDDRFLRRKSIDTLERLHWLQDKGCKFEFDFQEQTTELQKRIPDWKVEFASDAVNGRESKVGWVRTVRSFDELVDIPISRVLEKASELSGRQWGFFVEHDPFAGYVEEFPLRAYGALSNAARKNEYPEWAWRTFLHDKKRVGDAPRLTFLIARRVLEMPSAQLAAVIYPVCDWLLKVGGQLAKMYPLEFNRLVSHLTAQFRQSPDQFGTAIVKEGDEVDWVSEAINSPSGKLAEALMEDPRKLLVKEGLGFPRDWLEHWERLFELPGKLGCYALVIAAHNLPWFFHNDISWARIQLVSRLQVAGPENDALWYGFLWGLRQGPAYELFQEIKDSLFKIAPIGAFERHGYQENLASLLLFGWGVVGRNEGKRGITDQEMRNILLSSDETLRLNILWILKRWSEPIDENGPWPGLLPDFLSDAWPRQKSVKTAGVSAHLCDIAFANSHRFEEISGIVLGLVAPVTDDRFLLPELRDEGLVVIKEHPKASLDLLFAVLPDDVSLWPYGFEEVLDTFNEYGSGVHSDLKLIELNRKWNAR